MTKLRRVVQVGALIVSLGTLLALACRAQQQSRPLQQQRPQERPPQVEHVPDASPAEQNEPPFLPPTKAGPGFIRGGRRR